MDSHSVVVPAAAEVPTAKEISSIADLSLRDKIGTIKKMKWFTSTMLPKVKITNAMTKATPPRLLGIV